MNRNERLLLRPAINAVARRNRNAWWELKRQIFDGGYQSYYPAQGDFDAPAERAIAGLPTETKAALIAEWRGAMPARTPYTDAEILVAYARVVVEVVVERACAAAYKTENW
jgi:hypothetical protein